jgi:putative Mg2+ transporter-C (MgtC) family protein
MPAMLDIDLQIAIPLLAALAAGSLIGLERTYHGRPAGFRTHALVCLASALLMQVTTHQSQWMTGVPLEAIRLDPTRMAQGIMTGIGFLGAGVIFKEGLTVRGLTTAASIWITAALGVLYGIGFYFPAVLATIYVLGTLALFRWFEHLLPTQNYVAIALRFARDRAPDESEIRSLLEQAGFKVTGMSYRLEEAGSAFQYDTIGMTLDRDDPGRLAEALRGRGDLLSFSISPAGD